MALRSPTPDGLLVAPNAPLFGSNPAAVPDELQSLRFWGRFSLATQLPNVGTVNGVAVVGVNPAQNPAWEHLRPGDVALVQDASPPSQSTVYQCIDRGTLGGSNAVWLTMSGIPWLPPITESTTSRVLTTADHGRMILCTNAAGCTVDVPATLPPGFVVSIVQVGAGALVLDDDGGATTWIKPSASLTPPQAFGQGSTIGIEISALGVAVVYGSLG